MQGILLGLADVLGALIWFYQILVFAAVVLTWVNADPSNGLVRAVRAMTDPVFAWLRQRLPILVQSGLDLTPFAVLLICMFLNKALVFNLHKLAAGV